MLLQETKDIEYECQDMFSHEIIATFDTYDEADNFMDAAYDMPDWWTTPAMTIVEVARRVPSGGRQMTHEQIIHELTMA